MEEKDNDMVAIKKETFSNNDINIYIDDDSLRTSQEIVGKEFSYHVAEAEKSLVRAVSNINQCQVSLSVIGQEISYTEKILSIISNLKIVKQTLGKFFNFSLFLIIFIQLLQLAFTLNQTYLFKKFPLNVLLQIQFMKIL